MIASGKTGWLPRNRFAYQVYTRTRFTEKHRAGRRMRFLYKRRGGTNIGASQAGLRDQCRGAARGATVFTNLTRDHLDFMQPVGPRFGGSASMP